MHSALGEYELPGDERSPGELRGAPLPLQPQGQRSASTNARPVATCLVPQLLLIPAEHLLLVQRRRLLQLATAGELGAVREALKEL